MDYIEDSKELLDFIAGSPSMFHSVGTMRKYLDNEGFTYLKEADSWDIKKGGSYYTTRNDSSILAFKVGSKIKDPYFKLAASHTDSPSFKVKSLGELEGPDGYLRLNVEGYGGMIFSTWFDRPLSLAGRVLVDTAKGVEARLCYIDKDILIIPNTAIHMDRTVNSGYKYNIQLDLLPLFSAGQMEKGSLDKMIGESLGVASDKILAKDLYLVNRQEGKVWGYKDEFISSPKLDDLQAAFASLKAFIQGQDDEAINVFVSFDNEEVGSLTKQGANSTFLKDSLVRIKEKLAWSQEDYHRAIARSFLLSCDNAHAVHPNHPDKTDPVNKVRLNKGPVIKENAEQKYTSDAFSQAVFKKICQKASVPYQNFANRSDCPGGSTLGNISNMEVSLHAVDIGIAQLAMHSAYETAGSRDTSLAIRAIKEFYDTRISIDEARAFVLD